MVFIKLGFEALGKVGHQISNSQLMHTLEIMIEKCEVPEGSMTAIIMPDGCAGVTIRCEVEPGKLVPGEKVIVPITAFMKYEQGGVNTPIVNHFIDILAKYFGNAHCFAYGIQQ